LLSACINNQSMLVIRLHKQSINACYPPAYTINQYLLSACINNQSMPYYRPA
jgi:hypothetical protein